MQIHAFTHMRSRKQSLLVFILSWRDTLTEKQRDVVIPSHAGPVCDGWLQWSEIRWECHKFQSYPLLHKRKMSSNLSDNSSHSEPGHKNELMRWVCSFLFLIRKTKSQTQEIFLEGGRHLRWISRRNTNSLKHTPSNKKGAQLLTSGTLPYMFVNLLGFGGCRAIKKKRRRARLGVDSG